MQSDLQAQGNLPTQQPSTQPGFAVGHNRPFAQPQQAHPQQGQYAQPPQYAQQGHPGYLPPTQYGMPMPMPNQQAYGDRLTRGQIHSIDENLSSGCYCFWNFWLYIMIIEGLAGIYTSGKAMLAWWSYVFIFLMAITTLAYAFIMITAMKKKDLGKAEIGVKLAIMNMVLYVIGLYVQFTVYAYLAGSDQAKKIVIQSSGVFAFYYFFAQLFPAFKIRKHLQAREALVQKASVPYNA